jgi:hypothetical protein
LSLFGICLAVSWVCGQNGFSSKTPIGGWLQLAGTQNEILLAFGAAGKIVWQPFEVRKWLNWFEESNENSHSLALAKWWLSGKWEEAKDLSLPSLSILTRFREMAARKSGDSITWERLSFMTLSYHPTKRWGILVQLRHRDFLPFLEAYPSPSIEVATVRGFIGTTVWEFGRQYQRWGPGFLGTSLISDNGYPLDGISFNLQAKLPVIGRWKILQLMAYLHGDLSGRFLMARRWEKSLGEKLSIGANEINLSRSFSPLTLILPFYITSRLAVHSGWRKEGSDQVILSADVSYRSGDSNFYGILVVDDLKLRWWRKEEQIYRKLGWILGAQHETKKWGIGAEYASFDRLTYTHIVQAPYLYHGIGLGYPTGADSRAVSLWGRWQVNSKFQVSGVLVRSWLDRKTANKDKERYWALSLQWKASPNTLLALHWSQGYPPKWGVGGGWSEQQERTRFVILEGRFVGLWRSKVRGVETAKVSVQSQEAGVVSESKFAWLTSLRDGKGRISAGEREGIKVGMRLRIVDVATNEVVGTFTVTQVKVNEATGRVEAIPNKIVRIGSKVMLPLQGQ